MPFIPRLYNKPGCSLQEQPQQVKPEERHGYAACRGEASGGLFAGDSHADEAEEKVRPCRSAWYETQKLRRAMRRKKRSAGRVAIYQLRVKIKLFPYRIF
jgi:hypothetical protein